MKERMNGNCLATRLLVLAVVGWVACAAPVRAGRIPRVELRSVPAIEETDSVYGRYRVVFTTAAPLPPSTDTTPDPQFRLGGHAVVTPPGAPADETIHAGYLDALPTGPAVFEAVVPTGEDTPLVVSSVPVDAPALLSASRPQWGRPEAAHVQRAVRDVDLWAEWNAADVVAVAVFVRNDIDRHDIAVWQRTFQVVDVLRGTGVAKGDRLTFDGAGAPPVYEIGVRYVVFAHLAPAGGVDPHRHAAVRVWWPHDDYVLEFLRQRAALGVVKAADGAAKRRVRPFLFAALSSPAAEVRRTAALEIARVGGKTLAADERTRLRDALAAEPSPAVRKSLRALLGS